MTEQLDRREVLAEALDKLEETPQEISPPVRSRDESGKFTQKSDAAPGAPAAVEVSDAPAAEKTEQPVEEPLWKRPPASWKKEFHETWGKLPAEAQQYVARREDEMKAGVQPLLSKAQFADQVNKAIEPYQQTMRNMNIDAPTAIAGLMQADHVLRYAPMQQKVQYFAKLAQDYGIDLVSAIQGGQFTAPPAPDPAYQSLAQTLAQVNGQVERLTKAQQDAEEAQLRSEVDKFSKGAEFFEVAKPSMIQLLQSGQALDLQSAYEQVIESEAFKPLIEMARQAQSVKAKDRAAKVSRSAAVSVRSSAPGANTATKAQDRRSVLAEQFDSLSDRL